MASAGSGRETWKPCARSQPSSSSRRQASCDSTPSATTFRPRLCARSIVERTIAASDGSCGMSITNDLSILMPSTGSRLRLASDE